MKKITLYYREMKEYEGYLPEEIGPVVIFKTHEGGYGIRRQCHGWKAGDTVWTPDGKQPTKIIAVSSAERFDVLFGILRTASYYVNRFPNESERSEFLDQLEEVLLANVA